VAIDWNLASHMYNCIAITVSKVNAATSLRYGGICIPNDHSVENFVLSV